MFVNLNPPPPPPHTSSIVPNTFTTHSPRTFNYHHVAHACSKLKHERILLNQLEYSQPFSPNQCMSYLFNNPAILVSENLDFFTLFFSRSME